MSSPKKKSASAFEYTKDAKTLRRFFDRLSKTNVKACNVVFLAVIDNCSAYEQLRNNRIIRMLRDSVNREGRVEYSEEDYLEMESYRLDNRNQDGSLSDLGIAMLYVRGRSDTHYMSYDSAYRPFNLIKYAGVGEEILPHLKLALAYCPLTNGELT